MTTKVVLHVGLHKTGSSALQEFLSANTALLASLGAEYPERLSAFPAHQELAWCLMKQAPAWADRAYVAKEVLSHYRRQAEESDREILILSSEDLSSLDTDPASIEALRETFADYDVSIVVYLRPQIDFLVSLYHHAVRSGNEQRTFLEYFQESVRLRAVQYERRLAVWNRIFGHEHLLIRHYDRATAKQGGIAKDFFEALELDVSLDDVAPTVNIGIHPALSEAHRYINKLAVEGTEVGKAKRTLLDLSRTLPKVDVASYYLEENQLSLLEKLFEETNIALKNQYGFDL